MAKACQDARIIPLRTPDSDAEETVRARVPAGDYIVALASLAERERWGRKVYDMEFQVLEGDFAGTQLPHFVAKVTRKGRRGCPSLRSTFAKEFRRFKQEMFSMLIMPSILFGLIGLWLWIVFTQMVPSLTQLVIQSGGPIPTLLSGAGVLAQRMEGVVLWLLLGFMGLSLGSWGRIPLGLRRTAAPVSVQFSISSTSVPKASHEPLSKCSNVTRVEEMFDSVASTGWLKWTTTAIWDESTLYLFSGTATGRIPS